MGSLLAKCDCVDGKRKVYYRIAIAVAACVVVVVLSRMKNPTTSLNGIVTSTNSVEVIGVEVEFQQRRLVIEDQNACRVFTQALKHCRRPLDSGGMWYRLSIAMSDGSKWISYCYVSRGYIQFALAPRLFSDDATFPTHLLEIPQGQSSQWDAAFEFLMNEKGRNNLMTIDASGSVSVMPYDGGE